MLLAAICWVFSSPPVVHVFPAGAIQTTNSAVFGLGPLGEWQATIHGTWAAESGSLARVAFNAYSVQLLGAFGWRPLAEFLEVSKCCCFGVAGSFYCRQK